MAPLKIFLDDFSDVDVSNEAKEASSSDDNDVNEDDEDDDLKNGADDVNDLEVLVENRRSLEAVDWKEPGSILC